MTKLTRKQVVEIVTIAGLRRGPYPAYPYTYIAALYGVSRERVSQLAKEAGQVRRSGPVRSIAHMGLRKQCEPSSR